MEVKNLPSKKILDEKKKFVSDLSENLKSAKTGVLVDYKGITVAEDTKMRKELRESGSSYRVIKNSLLRLALQQAGIEGLDSFLVGTTAVAVHGEDYVAPAKVLSKYAKASKQFTVKAGFIDGKAVTAAEIDTLGSLPSKDVLLSMVLRGLNGPITGLVTVLNGTVKGLVVALNAIAEQKKSA
jgi:large subunit ribosomal protein L10